jgi:hypothetical protein
MNKKFTFLPLLLLLLCTQCASTDLATQDYFVFGSYTSACDASAKDCTKLIKYDNYNLYPDDVKYFDANYLVYSKNSLSLDNLTRVIWLRDHLNSYMTYSPGNVGTIESNAYYIESYVGGQTKRWIVSSKYYNLNDAVLTRYMDSLVNITKSF